MFRHLPLHPPSVVAAAAALVLLLGGTSSRAQPCDVDILPGVGGIITGETDTGFATDPELDIEIATDLSFVRLENSQLKVVYSGFRATHSEYAIRDFIIKEANEDQSIGSGDFMAAGAGRGPLASATLLVDEAHRKTVRLEWYRWSISNQQVSTGDRILIDVSIYPHQPFLQFDNLDIRWHSTVVDLASPGGTTSGNVHISHGAAGWNRGYNTHDEAPYVGSYYDRYPPDGVNDPADGGSLNYNGHFVMATFNPMNGRGFGRVLPVAHTSIIKLLLNPSTRRGIESGHHPFYNAHPPFTTYLYAVTAGSHPLALGRALADAGGVQPQIECGDTIQLNAEPYSDWLFASWTDDLISDPNNPTSVLVSEDLTVGAAFDQAPGDYTNDFESNVPGDDPIDWMDTAADNSFTEDDALFEVIDDGGNLVFGTTSTSTNIHSHYLGGVGGGGIGHELSGRLKVSEADGGVGVTLFSQFPSQASYYRLRRSPGGSFRLNPLGTILNGVTDTGVIPLPGVWYRFRFQAEDTGVRTELRAMLWKDGVAEPDDWQAEAWDDSPGRIVDGAAGIWTMGSGAKYVDDVALNALQPPPTDLVLTINEVGSGSVTATPDQVEYTQGDVVTLQATGSGGQVFSGWSGDLSGLENPTQITMLGDQTVTATFIDPTIHSLTLNVVGQGTITPSPDQAQYLLGDAVQLTASADPGWLFTGWSQDLQGTENPAMLTISGDTQVTATFVEIVLAEDFESVSPGDNPPDFLDTGSGNSLLEDDSLFSVLLVDGEQVLGTTSNQVNVHSHYVGTGPDALDKYEFTGRMRFEDAAAGIGVTFSSQMPEELAYYRLRRYEGTSFHLAPVGTVLAGLTDTGVFPTPGLWYQFKIQLEAGTTTTEVRAKVWAEGGAEPVDWQAQAFDSATTRLTSGTIGVWSMSSGAKYWDDFLVTPIQGPPPILTLDVTVVGNGSVTATPDQPLYGMGQIVNLLATPDPNHLFTGWSGASSSTAPSIDVTMDADASITASFLEIQPHPLTVNLAGLGSGTVAVSPDLPSYLTGDVVTLTATPASDSSFDGWSGDATSGEFSIQVTILGPTSLDANFSRPTYVNYFEGLAVGASPADWFDTGANNSLAESPGLFTIRDVDGQQAFGTDSVETNVHSHWLGPIADTLADYTYSGRFRISDDDGGIGLTALSQFPDEVAYYRLRRFLGTTIHLAPVGTMITSGTTDTGVNPFTDIWYRFLMEVEDTGTETVIRAKVWEEGAPEPPFFPVVAMDASPTRLTAGTFGVWSMGPGSKSFDDLTLLPEPGSVGMLAAGAFGLAMAHYRRRRHKRIPAGPAAEVSPGRVGHLPPMIQSRHGTPAPSRNSPPISSTQRSMRRVMRPAPEQCPL